MPHRELMSAPLASLPLDSPASLTAVPDAIRDEIMQLCAYYLLRAKRGHAPLDPVARFHLANGARLARLNWGGDASVGGHRVVSRDHRELHLPDGRRRREPRGVREGLQGGGVVRARTPGARVVIVDDRVSESGYARPANSRVSVCTFTLSPSLMNSGTRISSPVSSVASLVTPPLAVSPRTPGSV